MEMMEKGKKTSDNAGEGMVTMGVKVMTDEQMEMLRKQISVYATLCDSLLNSHKSLSSQPHHHFPPSGMRIGNPYCDPLLTSTVHKLTSRQRWTPKPQQLEILEGIFDKCNTTPSRQRIKDIAAELAHHGPISEANVSHWFQNRRARSKRKQSGAVSQKGEAEVEMETETEIDKEKKMKQDDVQADENSPLLVSHMYFDNPDIGIDQLMGKLDGPGIYTPYWEAEQHDLFN